MNDTAPPTLLYRPYRPEDYPDLKRVMQLSYSDIDDTSYASEEEMALLSGLYPKGQIVCELDGRVVGAMLVRVVPFARYCVPHNQAACIDTSRYVEDTANGDTVYGLDAFVDPEHRKLKIGREVQVRAVQQVFADNFPFYIGTSRLTGYAPYRDTMSIEAYVKQVRERTLTDAALSYHARVGDLFGGVEYVCDNPNFSEADVVCGGFGAVLRFPNQAYDPTRPTFPERGERLRGFGR